MIVTFDAELWIWEARPDETWTFVSLPEEAADEIEERAAGPRRGFGAVRVQVRIGTSTWRTSIFPDAGRKTYVLPVKKAVRRAESLSPGDRARITVDLLP